MSSPVALLTPSSTQNASAPAFAMPRETGAPAGSNEGITRVLRLVEWKDLLALSPGRIIYETTLPAPYLLLSLFLAHLGFTRHWLWLGAAILASFFVFLTALRVVHNAYHYSLVLPLIFVPAVPPVLRYHILAMAVGQCLFPFFGVWSVHHDVHAAHTIARTLRRTLENRVTFGMFYHLEHHLFPRVPTCRLTTLASRIDRHIDPEELEHVF